MDDITHAALGAACAQIVLGRKNKQIPWQAGAIAAVAADIDVFIRFGHGPMNAEFWHRNFTHALIFIPLGALIVTLALICFSHFRTHWRLTYAACFIGYATHAVLDACTSYGTMLLWPWSNARISWDVISIVDPVFTLPLLIAVIWSIMHHKPKYAFFGVAFAAFFLAFNTYQHHRALETIEVYAKQSQQQLTNPRALPALMSSTRWRAIANHQNCLFIANSKTPLWSTGYLTPVDEVPAYNETLIPFKLTVGQKEDISIFSWFTDKYLVIANTKPFLLADARYTSGDHPVFSLWGIELKPKQDHISKVGVVSLEEHCMVQQNTPF